MTLLIVRTADTKQQRLESIQEAFQTYLARPDPETLLGLTASALPLLETNAAPPWRHIRAKETLRSPFTAIRAVCDRAMPQEETQRFSSCLGYALKAQLAGEELSVPVVAWPVWNGEIWFTVLEYIWSSQTSTRTSPDVFQAFALARQYVFEGTPLRTTDREGKGTKDTRLVEGIAPCNLAFYVR